MCLSPTLDVGYGFTQTFLARTVCPPRDNPLFLNKGDTGISQLCTVLLNRPQRDVESLLISHFQGHCSILGTHSIQPPVSSLVPGIQSDSSLLPLLTVPQSVTNSPAALCAPLCVSEADSLEQVAVGKGNCILQLCRVLSVSLGGSWTFLLLQLCLRVPLPTASPAERCQPRESPPI